MIDLSIDVLSGNLHIEIPLYTSPQRGGLYLRYKLIYDSATWDMRENNQAFKFYERGYSGGSGGWRLITETNGAIRTSPFGFYDTSQVACPPDTYTDGPDKSADVYYPFYLQDWNGTTRTFPVDHQTKRDCRVGDGTPIAQGYSDDGDGYFLSVKNYNEVDQVFNASGEAPSRDTNGNFIGTTDSVGRSVLQTSISDAGQHSLTFPTQAGSSSVVITTSAAPAVCTNFYGGNPPPSTSEFCDTSLSQRITAVQILTGQSFHFDYDSGGSPGHYGGLNSIQLPTGESLTFTYLPGYTDALDSGVPVLRVTQATVGTAVYDIVYSALPGGGHFTVSGSRQICGVTTTEHSSCVRGPSRFDVSANAFVRDETIYSAPVVGTQWPNLATIDVYSGAAAGGSLIKRTTFGDYAFPGRPGFIKQTLDDGSSSIVRYMYGASVGSTPLNFVTAKKEWDFGKAETSTPDRETDVEFDHSSDLVNAHILDRVKSIKKYDQGTKISQVDYGYDEWDLSTVSGYQNNSVAGIASHDDTNYSSNRRVGRGNLTSVTQYINMVPGDTISSSFHYNILGQLVYQVDGRGNETDYDYTDCFGAANSTSCTNSGTFAYQTRIRNAKQQETSFRYSADDGAVVAHKDANSETVAIARDAAGRVTDTWNPDGGHISVDFGGTQHPDWVTTTVIATPNPSIETRVVLDSQGRKIDIQRLNQPSSCSGGTIHQKTAYDLVGKVVSETTPYCASSDSYTTGYDYDALGRMIRKTNPDSSKESNVYSGSSVTFIDESTRKSKLVRNAFGDITDVYEDPSGLSLHTNYIYDALGNLKTVTQSGVSGEAARTRTFNYDSLSRLTKSCNPESLSVGNLCDGNQSWSFVYSYDANGNLTYRTDARGIITQYTYDALNRLTDRTYPSGDYTNTPSAHYRYDVAQDTHNSSALFAASNPIGRLTYQWTGDGGTPETWNGFSYDAMGRVTTVGSCTPRSCGHPRSDTQFSYDLAGNEISRSFGVDWWHGNYFEPFQMSYDNAGRLSDVRSVWNDAYHPEHLLSNIVYSPMGMTSAKIGNDLTGLLETRSYDTRGRLTDVLLSRDNRAATSTDTPPVCGGPSSSMTLSQNGMLNIDGWLVDHEDGAPSAGVEVLIDGNVIGRVRTGTHDRPDVVAAFSQPGSSIYDSNASNFLHSGWLFSGSIGSLSVGTHTLATRGMDFDGNQSTCWNQATLTVSSHQQIMSWIDGSGTNPTVNQGATLTVSGWAVSPDGSPQSPVSQVELFLDGKSVGLATLGDSRPDVASGTGIPGAAQSGWHASIPIGNIAVGIHRISAIATDSAQSTNTGPIYTFQVVGSNPSSAPTITGNTVYSESLSYEPNGNVQQMIDSLAGTWRYYYDALNRLTNAGVSLQPSYPVGQWLQYSYDSFGNRYPTNMTASTNAWQFTAQNQMPSAAGFVYDSAGNMLSTNVPASMGGHTFGYDAENRVRWADAGAVSYVYNASGQRVGKYANGNVIEEYLYDPQGRRITTVGPDFNMTRGELFAGGRQVATYITANGSDSYPRFPITDHLGTTRLVASSTGAVLETCSSQPFGDGQTCSGEESSDRHFTGKERDVESGLDYFGARYYNSTTGRFMSPDPYNANLIKQNMVAGGLPDEAAQSLFDGFIGNPQRWNGYSYALNNPLRFIDRTGAAPAEGHHLIPERDYIHSLLGKNFADYVKTGPLSGNGAPNQPGRNVPHVDYNDAVGDMLDEAETKLGSSNNWSLSQWKDFATKVLKSDEPAIKDFLDELDHNNPGAKAALARAIASYQISRSLAIRMAAASASATAAAAAGRIMSEFLVCFTCNLTHYKVTSRIIPPID
ncbi:RHS repeat domain-containing protein [Terriglobus sp. 2YAB30_2]|uniref:RHS repeat domain-containing protein n=1 Tax=Terriglobus sp. 2YAB30_2 TaxID=3233023 RepID=UPI003F95EEF7